MHAQIYWNLLSTQPGSTLKLTKHDDAILTHLALVFPDFDATKEVDEDEMKNKSGKAKWRDFMEHYKEIVPDYNFGTLVRRSSGVEYGEKDTMFVPRMQFYALEIARNRKGLNDWVFEQAQKEKAAEGQ